MTVALTELSALIARTAAVAGGQPCIAGTGVTVYWVGFLATREGLSAEEIRRDVIGEQVSLAQIYAALAYFHLNREALEAEADRLDGIADEQAAELPPLAP